jgi:chemotaxis protein CheZ
VAGVDGSDRGIGALVQAAVRAELGSAFDDLRRFVDRRIAELSVEIHGATQLMDFSEANLSGQLTHIQQEIARVVAVPMAATRNSGLELEAVVQATEKAANQIMEAAEAIGAWLEQGRGDPAALEAIHERLNTIFEACTFQDLTGQRIHRAIEHLQKVEEMLTVLSPNEEADAAPAAPPPDLGQSDVDEMFG